MKKVLTLLSGILVCLLMVLSYCCDSRIQNSHPEEPTASLICRRIVRMPITKPLKAEWKGVTRVAFRKAPHTRKNRSFGFSMV
jgi:hypothetical protein